MSKLAFLCVREFSKRDSDRWNISKLGCWNLCLMWYIRCPKPQNILYGNYLLLLLDGHLELILQNILRVLVSSASNMDHQYFQWILSSFPEHCRKKHQKIRQSVSMRKMSLSEENTEKLFNPFICAWQSIMRASTSLLNPTSWKQQSNEWY